MQKNELIKLYALLERKCREITPSVYACIALALHRKCGWGFKKISDIFAESQDIWNECLQRNENMVQMCEEETGINVCGRIEE